MSVVIYHLKLTAQSAQEIRSCTTNDNNQTSYQVYEMPPDTLEDLAQTYEQWLKTENERLDSQEAERISCTDCAVNFKWQITTDIGS